MKKLLIGAAALCVISVPAAAHYVYVETSNQRDRFEVGELDEADVCTLKQQVARHFDLNIKKFDLYAGSKLREGLSLAENRVRNSSSIKILKSNSSQQCT